jgi:hypothetical protein
MAVYWADERYPYEQLVLPSNGEDKGFRTELWLVFLEFNLPSLFS